MTLKALIFDIDGTLAETERDGHRVAFNEAFAAAGLNWHWSVDLYGDLLPVAGGKERIQFYIEQYAPPLPERVNLPHLVTQLHQNKNQRYTALVAAEKIALRPGVWRLIQAARAEGIRLAIATTSHIDNAIALLTHTMAPDAPNWFEIIAAGDMVPRKKPAADVYEYVLDRLALPAAQCLAIEDTQQGLIAATGAGIKTVVTVNSYTQGQDFSLAALVLSHLGEPDEPCTVLAGGGEMSYFSLETARKLVEG
jgi:HAD superfamily hydrolase (TIGR01509 family)